jgi:hypothetical protein
MDENTELLLKAAQARQWENEERSSYDLETMRKEFCDRLYAAKKGVAAPGPEKKPKKP